MGSLPGCRLFESSGSREGEDQKQNDGYQESMLSLEIHDFFRMGREIPALPNISAGEGLFKLWQRLELDGFELFCVILAMLSGLDYHFEKLFVYLNNDWNQRLLSVEWAMHLYTMEPEPDGFCLSYFLPDGKLAKQVFDIQSEGACSGLRRGLKLKPHILEFLLCSEGSAASPIWNGILTQRIFYRHGWRSRSAPVWNLQNGGGQSTEKQSFSSVGDGKRELFLYPVWYAQKEGSPWG